MLWYGLKCKKGAESKKQKVVKTKNGRAMVFSKCAVCNSKNQDFFQRARSYWIIIISSRIKTLLVKFL